VIRMTIMTLRAASIKIDTYTHICMATSIVYNDLVVVVQLEVRMGNRGITITIVYQLAASARTDGERL
jgi:hypothetical protein